ncbi:hypothetical protein SAMN04487969_10990 [Paenibacillus algorifonticola]|uniref:Uncharacterized protein n=1 Tax=Paenibacillus algorifonticola TaxID=684063 RepID=A0A1I2EGW0_9BACL|nr:hypothetical protein [Paenibacillus algorifonticola]SFE91786.1 hypothetical protein SAMN04487969_10990 [Paenibacillus algorifonticola]
MARVSGQNRKRQEGQAPCPSFSVRFDKIGKWLGIAAAALLIACLLAQTALQSSTVRHLLSGVERMEGTRLQGQVSS